MSIKGNVMRCCQDFNFCHSCFKSDNGSRKGVVSISRDEFKIRLNAIQWLPVEISHCAELTKLPFHHRDPFDRMLIAQAMVEDLQMLSRDSRFLAYEIKRIW